jgi:hypothetical protein
MDVKVGSKVNGASGMSSLGTSFFVCIALETIKYICIGFRVYCMVLLYNLKQGIHLELYLLMMNMFFQDICFHIN